MLPLRTALQRTLFPPRPSPHPRALPPSVLPRLLSTPPSRPPAPPSEASIVSLLRRGDFEGGVRRFCKRPRAQRSNALYETVILACAQVPDAFAAEAVLRAMPRPTLSAVHSVVAALCRECNVPAAIDVLERTPAWRIPLDPRLVAAVTRAAQRSPRPDRDRDLHRIDILAAQPRRHHHHPGGRPPALHTASAADFFVEDGGDGAAWLQALTDGHMGRPEPQSRRSLKKVMSAEASLRAARGDVRRVNELWGKIQNNPRLNGEVGVLAAAVSALVSSGWHGGANALNILMTWVHEHLYDGTTGRGRTAYTDNASAMALLVTSASKAMAAAARPEPELALSAIDALWKMDLPRFSSSLPLAGAYFKVLQHAGLSLEETSRRIEEIRQHHIQLDEQGFSMALGAILRCDERVVDKLAAGKVWVESMAQAGIPLTVQTYNLFAGQVRYCNDPELVGKLLSDMSDAGVVPTAVTYGLVFSACVIPGEYSSGARRKAVAVEVWESVLEGMQEHMAGCGVSHTGNSRLSLARAYAHLGLVERGLEEFEEFLGEQGVGMESAAGRRAVGEAYSQMMFNFAHCREGSGAGPEMAVALYERAVGGGGGAGMCGAAGMGQRLESALVGCVRTGQGARGVGLAAEAGEGIRLGTCGVRHLLMGLVQTGDAEMWERCRGLVVGAGEVVRGEGMRDVVEKVVMAFARKGCGEVCEDVLQVAGVEMRDLGFVAEGREFLRFRKGKRGGGGVVDGRGGEDGAGERRGCGMVKDGTGTVMPVM